MKILWGSPVQRPTALLLWKRRFAQRLSKTLKGKDITIPALALRSGLPVEFLKRVMKAKIYPSFEARSMIGKALGVTEEFLVS